MSNLSATARRRLDLQGFASVGDEYLGKVHYWLRLAPAVVLLWTATGVWLAAPAVLWALVPFAVLGGRRSHPFDAVYNHYLRYRLGRPPLPDYRRPRRFACLAFAAPVAASALAFEWGYSAAGYAAGGLVLALAAVQVATGFCVSSYVYRLWRGKSYGPVVSDSVRRS